MVPLQPPAPGSQPALKALKSMRQWQASSLSCQCYRFHVQPPRFVLSKLIQCPAGQATAAFECRQRPADIPLVSVCCGSSCALLDSISHLGQDEKLTRAPLGRFLSKRRPQCARACARSRAALCWLRYAISSIATEAGELPMRCCKVLPAISPIQQGAVQGLAAGDSSLYRQRQNRRLPNVTGAPPLERRCWAWCQHLSDPLGPVLVFWGHGRQQLNHPAARPSWSWHARWQIRPPPAGPAHTNAA